VSEALGAAIGDAVGLMATVGDATGEATGVLVKAGDTEGTGVSVTGLVGGISVGVRYRKIN
jgi:hypothetical protein